MRHTVIKHPLSKSVIYFCCKLKFVAFVPSSLPFRLVTTSIQALVREVNSCLQPSFISMSKIPWSSMNSVGDQSEYVVSLSNVLCNLIQIIRKTVTNSKQFKWFCDKFVEFVQCLLS